MTFSQVRPRHHAYNCDKLHHHQRRRLLRARRHVRHLASRDAKPIRILIHHRDLTVHALSRRFSVRLEERRSQISLGVIGPQCFTAINDSVRLLTTNKESIPMTTHARRSRVSSPPRSRAFASSRSKDARNTIDAPNAMIAHTSRPIVSHRSRRLSARVAVVHVSHRVASARPRVHASSSPSDPRVEFSRLDLELELDPSVPHTSTTRHDLRERRARRARRRDHRPRDARRVARRRRARRSRDARERAVGSSRVGARDGRRATSSAIRPGVGTHDRAVQSGRVVSVHVGPLRAVGGRGGAETGAGANFFRDTASSSRTRLREPSCRPI